MAVPLEDLSERLGLAFQQQGYFYGRPAVRMYTGFSLSTYEKRFGTWTAACESAGFCLLQGARVSRPIPCKRCGALTSCHTRADTKYCSVSCSNRARSTGAWQSPARTWDEWLAELAERREYLLNEAAFESLPFEWKRARVINEQHCKCNRCSLDLWLGEPLTLEVDHKNGDNADHRRENMEALCPNCHSLTPTWRGRNKKRLNKAHRGHGCNPERLRADIALGMSLSTALQAQGYSGKGTGHARAKTLLLNEHTDV